MGANHCFKIIYLEVRIISFYFILYSFPRNGLGPWLQQTWEWHYSCSYVSNTDLLNVVLIAVLFTVVRHILNEVLLKVCCISESHCLHTYSKMHNYMYCMCKH